MNLRQRKGFKAIALFLAFAIAQICVQISLAAPGMPGGPLPLPQQFVARLTTRGNQPILVNGNSAASGASILTGATIETPADVGATIDLGALGSLDLAPNTKVELQFDDNGNVKVKLIVGCVALRMKKGNGEVNTEQGTADQTNKKKRGVFVCFPPGASAPTVSQQAAADVGAGGGAGATTTGVTGGTVGGGGGAGLGTAATVGIIGAAVFAGILIPVAVSNRGGNPSSTSSTQ